MDYHVVPTCRVKRRKLNHYLDTPEDVRKQQAVPVPIITPPAKMTLEYAMCLGHQVLQSW